MSDITIHKPKAEWTSRNPVLPNGTFGFEEETGKVKLGDGVKRWIALAYQDVPPYTLPPDQFPTGAVNGASLVDGTVTKAKLGFTIESAGLQLTSYYVWKELGGNVKAMARLGSGLPAIPDGNASTVIQACINALTVKTGSRSVSGGRIHIARGFNNEVYFLTNELTITGWEGITGTGGVPESQLQITGDGATQLVQQTAGQNAIVIKNLASVVLKDFRIYCAPTAKSCILGDKTGVDSEMSLWRSTFDNLYLASNSTTQPALYLKNFFTLLAPTLTVQSSDNHGVVLENDSTTTNYGNSHFGVLITNGANAQPYAGLVIRSVNANKFPNLLTFDNFECLGGYYGLYTKGAKFSTFNFVDIEGIPRPVYFDGEAGNNETRYVKIKSGYLLPSFGGTAITSTAMTGGNDVTAHIQCDDTAIPILDQSNFRPVCRWDVELVSTAAEALISIARPNDTALTIRRIDGSILNRLPAGSTMTTPTAGDNTTKVATTAFVRTAINPAASVKTTNYTLVAADANTVIEVNSATAVTITIPNSVLPTNSSVKIVQVGAGQVTLAQSGTMNLRTSTALTTRAQYAVLEVRARSATEAVVDAPASLADLGGAPTRRTIAGAYTLIAADVNRLLHVEVTQPGPTPAISDNFNAASFDTAKWSNVTNASHVSGRLRVTPVAEGVGQPATAAVNNLTQAPIWVELPTLPVADPQHSVQFMLFSSDYANSASITVGGSPRSIYSFATGGDAGGFMVAAGSYNATTHRWLRFVISAGNLLYQTSADGITWTTQRTVTAPAWMTAAPVRASLQAKLGTSTNPSPGYAEFDNFNIYANPAATDIVVTVPTDATASIPIDTPIPWRVWSTTGVTFTPASGVTLISESSLFSASGRGAEGILTRIEANTWLLSGNLK